MQTKGIYDENKNSKQMKNMQWCKVFIRLAVNWNFEKLYCFTNSLLVLIISWTSDNGFDCNKYFFFQITNFLLGSLNWRGRIKQAFYWLLMFLEVMKYFNNNATSIRLFFLCVEFFSQVHKRSGIPSTLKNKEPVT